MEYSSDNFNGEISNRLSTGFRIPLKAPPKKPLNEDPDTWKDEDSAETFTSPLLSCEQDENDKIPIYSSSGKSQHRFDGIHGSGKKRKADEEERQIYGRDNSYPAELNFLIQSLRCNLCNTSMNSIRSARDHYESKAHDKKITNWLTEWCSKTGEPMPKIRRLVKDGPAGPNVLHCDACDLALTSLQHASQHYNGKRHKMVVAYLKNPSGSGYYDNEGKWVRQQTKVKESNSRYGIGESFVAKETLPQPSAPSSASPSAPALGPPSAPPPLVQAKNSEQARDPSIFCDICNISVTSEQQMKMHLQGSKHAKKLKLLGKPPYAPPGDTILASMQAATQSNPHNDISMYRTPSGSYYCMICNMTFPDSPVFVQHLDSKRHLNNLKKNSDSSANTKDTKN